MIWCVFIMKVLVLGFQTSIFSQEFFIGSLVFMLMVSEYWPGQ